MRSNTLNIPFVNGAPYTVRLISENITSIDGDLIAISDYNDLEVLMPAVVQRWGYMINRNAWSVEAKKGGRFEITVEYIANLKKPKSLKLKLMLLPLKVAKLEFLDLPEYYFSKL